MFGFYVSDGHRNKFSKYINLSSLDSSQKSVAFLNNLHSLSPSIEKSRSDKGKIMSPTVHSWYTTQNSEAGPHFTATLFHDSNNGFLYSKRWNGPIKYDHSLSEFIRLQNQPRTKGREHRPSQTNILYTEECATEASRPVTNAKPLQRSTLRAKYSTKKSLLVSDESPLQLTSDQQPPHHEHGQLDG